jgi:hypothetical protein
MEIPPFRVSPLYCITYAEVNKPRNPNNAGSKKEQSRSVRNWIYRNINCCFGMEKVTSVTNPKRIHSDKILEGRGGRTLQKLKKERKRKSP